MNITSLGFLFLLLFASASHATFSIVAVDTVTGEVGGAGASCIQNCRIINDFVIGVGAIHTQALYTFGNQNYAHDLMLAGWSPEQIIDSLVAHDVADDPSIRQYGIADLADGGRSAGYTGENCTDWAGHLTGPGFAVQGNILLGPEIIDTMYSAFTNTNGALTEKLLAALVAAKVPGADTRCLAQNKSAISAFIRVARIGDNPQSPYIYLNVGNTTGSTDPIDVLQDLYVNWVDTMSTTPDPFTSSVWTARDTLLANGADTTMIYVVPRNNQGQVLGEGVDLMIWSSSISTFSAPLFLGDSLYGFIMTSQSFPVTDTVTVYNLSGIREREFATHLVIHHVTASASPELQDLFPSTFNVEVFPNPFNNQFTLTLSVPFSDFASVELYNITGRATRTLLQEQVSAGTHHWSFNSDNLASGIYIVSASFNSKMQNRKIVLLK